MTGLTWLVFISMAGLVMACVHLYDWANVACVHQYDWTSHGLCSSV